MELKHLASELRRLTAFCGELDVRKDVILWRLGELVEIRVRRNHNSVFVESHRKGLDGQWGLLEWSSCADDRSLPVALAPVLRAVCELKLHDTPPCARWALERIEAAAAAAAMARESGDR
jgi:hypothetical protein